MQIDKTEFQALIKYYMHKRGMTGLNELSESTLISYKTLLKYWKDPERFPLGEVGRILDTLKIPVEEFLEKVIEKKSGGVKSEAEKDISHLTRRPTYNSSSRVNGNHYGRPCINMADIKPGEFQRITN